MENSKRRRLQMIETGHLADCEFIVETEPNEGDSENPVQSIFKCHKMILAMSSEVLERLLFGNFKDNTTVVIDDVSPAAFKMLLKYIYTYDLTPEELSTGQLRELFYLGYKYMMQDLIDTCVRILINRPIWLLPDILPTYQIACVYDNLLLMLTCYEKIQANYKHLMQHQTFYDLTLAQLKRFVVVLIQNSSVRLLEILKALESYGQHRGWRDLEQSSPDSDELKNIAELLDFDRFQIYPRPRSYLYASTT